MDASAQIAMLTSQLAAAEERARLWEAIANGEAAQVQRELERQRDERWMDTLIYGGLIV